ncbi:unnamed protein product [Prunus armeniaca]
MVGHPNLVELLEPHWTGPQEASKKDLMVTAALEIRQKKNGYETLNFSPFILRKLLSTCRKCV